MKRLERLSASSFFGALEQLRASELGYDPRAAAGVILRTCRSSG
jgi:hypothetical protein